MQAAPAVRCHAIAPSCRKPFGWRVLSLTEKLSIDINICSWYNYNTAFEKKDCLC